MSTSKTILTVASLSWIANPTVLIGSVLTFLGFKIAQKVIKVDHGLRYYQATILTQYTGEPITEILARWEAADKAAGKPVWPAEFKTGASPY